MELAFLILWPGLAIAAGVYAHRLNRSGFGWFVFALVLSPLLAFIFLLALGRREGESDRGRQACPFCAEMIKREATRCPHCQANIPREATADQFFRGR
jgi:hypothetical protein